jgi:hypothetical protein
MSRPRFVPTEEQRSAVKSMSAFGIKQEDIAAEIGLRSAKTLRKYFGKEIARGAVQANIRVGQTLFKMATSGEEPAATMFWLKTRAGWREVQVVETRPAAIPDFVVVPDKKAA